MHVIQDQHRRRSQVAGNRPGDGDEDQGATLHAIGYADLDPAPAHLGLAPTRKTGTCQDGHGDGQPGWPDCDRRRTGGLFTFIGAMESVRAGDAMVPDGTRNEESVHDD